MGVRESLLNTITSVADSDFVRIVTSAGASSKATVKNLFKGFESNLGAKSSLATSDYIRVVGSDNESYKQSLSAVADAVGAYNSTLILLTDCNNATDPSKIYYANGSTANRPTTTGWYFIKCEAYSDNMLFQTAFNMNTTNVEVWQRSRNTSGTWGAWVKQPTRAEVDALNSKRQTFWITAGSSLTIGSKNARYMLTLHGGNASYRGLYLVSGYASSIEMKAVSEVASGVITISGTNLTINNTNQYGMRVAVDMHEGNITV